MNREELEAIGAGVVIMALMALATITNIMILPLSGALGFLILSPVWWILSKTKKEYKYKWLLILQGIIIIIIHVVLTIYIGI